MRKYLLWNTVINTNNDKWLKLSHKCHIKKDHTFILERQSDILSSKNLFRTNSNLFVHYICFTYTSTCTHAFSCTWLCNTEKFASSFLQVCLKETGVLISILFACTQSGYTNDRSQNRGKPEIALLPDSKVSVFQISVIL